MEIHRLKLERMGAAAKVHRAAFDERLPWLSGLHTPEEDEAYFRDHVFKACEVWGALESDDLVGMIAFRQDWIDHLYVLPRYQARGFGTALLNVARLSGNQFHLWTFQKNGLARAFYEANGFVAIEQTDGDGNEEREPDVLYRWRAERHD
jgi:GNAT superfamily N-acetyltransferase